MPDRTSTNAAWDEHLIRYGMAFAPRLIAKARGTLIWDTEGRELLDFRRCHGCDLAYSPAPDRE